MSCLALVLTSDLTTYPQQEECWTACSSGCADDRCIAALLSMLACADASSSYCEVPRLVNKHSDSLGGTAGQLQHYAVVVSVLAMHVQLVVLWLPLSLHQTAAAVCMALLLQVLCRCFVPWVPCAPGTALCVSRSSSSIMMCIAGLEVCCRRLRHAWLPPTVVQTLHVCTSLTLRDRPTRTISDLPASISES